MSLIQPFRALRPAPAYSAEVASPPYDVLSAAEAREIVAERPHSFLRVVRAEVAFDSDSNPYSDEIYTQGKQVLQQYQKEGTLQRDKTPCYYIYRQQMGEHVQTGVVAGASCAEYDNKAIRIHEYTRPAKESDRIRHIETLAAQTGPVWLAYRAVAQIDREVERLSQGEPAFDFTAPDTIKHTGWVVEKEQDIQLLQQMFQEHVPLLYIADGHHRSAAASCVAQNWRDQKKVSAEHPSQFFLSVIYPHNQLKILAYNRHVHDLNGLSTEAFFEQLSTTFTRIPLQPQEPITPPERHQFSIFVDGSWHRLTTRPGIFQADDPIDALDVQILQTRVLAPILGIEDPRTSERIDFVGGTREHKELEQRVQKKGGIAFVCYPTSIEELFHVSDANQVMPPKSTWFAPKLRSGLFTYLLD